VALLDVNALIALAWDSHVHHAAMCAWFATNGPAGWATCPITESGFVRVSANPIVLPSSISVDAARGVISALRAHSGHRFLTDDVSMSDTDVPATAGYRQVTDAHLLTLAHRHGVRLVTFDASILAIGDGDDVELLTTL
jgi:toxin-antitoxin system PIN domain toxin